MPQIVASDLIASSMRLIGALGSSEVPNATEVRDGLATLNDLLEQWSTESLTVYSSATITQALTAGLGAYTIGPSGTIVGARPIAIDSAFVSFSGVDYPLEITRDAERYNDIPIKNLQGSIPELLYYDPSFPNGTIYLWPLPVAGTTITIDAALQFSQLTSGTQSINYPPGYSKALRYALALELAPEYQITPRADVVEIAADSKGAIKRVNAPGPLASPDPAWVGEGGSGYAQFIGGY